MSPDLDIIEDRLLHIREKVGQIKILTANVSLDDFKTNYEISLRQEAATARNGAGMSSTPPASAPPYLVQKISEFHLYYYQYGKLRRVFPVVFGKASTPTPVGRFAVYSKTYGPSSAFGPRVLWYHRRING